MTSASSPTDSSAASAEPADHSRDRIVVASPVQTVAAPVHENQRVEKRFTVTSDAATNTDVRQVQIYTPGLTVVRVRPELLEEIGPAVVAHVRVSSDAREHIERLAVDFSDKRELAVKYTPQQGTVGHLVTEIDVPRDATVRQVVAMCRGDVVVASGVVATQAMHGASSTTNASGSLLTTPTEDTPAVLSLRGARVFLGARHTSLRFDDILLGCHGSSQLHVAAQSLNVNKNLYGLIMGRGSIHMDVQRLCSPAVSLYNVGSGSISLQALASFHVSGLDAIQRGSGAIRVLAPLGPIAEQCVFQRIHVGGRGVVDVADIPSRETIVETRRPFGGIARIRAPDEKLTFDFSGKATSESVQLLGGFPPVVKQTERSTVEETMFAELTREGLTSRRAQDLEIEAVAVPTIESAFDTPAQLEKPREGWLLPAIGPMVRAFLPF